jgi:hypothetical protein
MSYAYDPTNKSDFLTILKELKNEDSSENNNTKVVTDSISK